MRGKADFITIWGFRFSAHTPVSGPTGSQVPIAESSFRFDGVSQEKQDILKLVLIEAGRPDFNGPFTD